MKEKDKKGIKNGMLVMEERGPNKILWFLLMHMQQLIPLASFALFVEPSEATHQITKVHFKL